MAADGPKPISSRSGIGAEISTHAPIISDLWPGASAGLGLTLGPL